MQFHASKDDCWGPVSIMSSVADTRVDKYINIYFIDCDHHNLLMNHFIDMAVQGYGWIAAA